MPGLHPDEQGRDIQSELSMQYLPAMLTDSASKARAFTFLFRFEGAWSAFCRKRPWADCSVQGLDHTSVLKTYHKYNFSFSSAEITSLPHQCYLEHN